jgi:hypothetical protein
MSSPLKFPYNNCVPYSISLDPGEYELEVWGAKGGSYSSSLYGGNGGYAKGTITFNEKTNVYIYVGASGSNSSYTHSCNGGGIGTSPDARSGGGATDIRINTNSLLSRVNVAGGGGGNGNCCSEHGGYGGGTNGGNGLNDGDAGVGGSQDISSSSCVGGSSNCPKGNFGFGGNATVTYNGGGGGGWYGGSAGSGSEGGGGGSGYVLTSSSIKPAGYLLNNAKYFLRNTFLIDGSQQFPATDKKGNERGHTGDGYAIITPIVIFQQTKLVYPPALDFSFNNSKGETINDIGAQFSFTSSGVYSSIIRPGKYIFTANSSSCGKSVVIEHNFLSSGNMTVNISSDITITMRNNVFLLIPGFMSTAPQHISEGSRIIFFEDMPSNCSRTDYSSLLITYQQYCRNTFKFSASNIFIKIFATLIITFFIY